MNNKIYATNGDKIAKLRVQHWAPGKKFTGGCPIPTFLVNEAKRMKSKRLIYVEVTIPDQISESAVIARAFAQHYPTKPKALIRKVSPDKHIISAWLFCRSKDTVDIDNGIALTISRLAVALNKADLGWHLSL